MLNDVYIKQADAVAYVHHAYAKGLNLMEYIDEIPAADVELKRKGAKLYTAHEVAVILAEAIGDDCACNVNGNDEWLPYHCDFRDTVCPNPVGVACWEQFLKHHDKKPKEVSNDTADD